MAAARIALADDQALVREGLKLLLRGLDIEIAVEAADGRELLDKLATAPVDVIVSDVRMPAMSGIEALRALRARGDRTPMILLTTFDDSAVLLEAVEAGAQGFLLKDAAPEDLRQGILQVRKGESLLQPVATDPVRERYAYRESSAPKELFTEREIAHPATARRRILEQGNRAVAVPGRRHGEELCVRHPRQARHARSNARRAEGHHAAHHLARRGPMLAARDAPP